MAGCRALVYVIAGLAVAGELPAELWGAAALLFVYVVGLTQVAKVEGGGILGAWPVAAVLAPVVYWAMMLPSVESFAPARGLRRLGRCAALRFVRRPAHRPGGRPPDRRHRAVRRACRGERRGQRGRGGRVRGGLRGSRSLCQTRIAGT